MRKIAIMMLSIRWPTSGHSTTSSASGVSRATLNWLSIVIIEVTRKANNATLYRINWTSNIEQRLRYAVLHCVNAGELCSLAGT